MPYKIVKRSYYISSFDWAIQDFEERIKTKIEEGYKPQGGLNITLIGNTKDSMIFTQAIYKGETNDS